jgi:hypothetical protein
MGLKGISEIARYSDLLKGEAEEVRELEVKNRNNACIHCGVRMIEKMPLRGPRRAAATWAHIINNASIVTLENIARCGMA